MLYSSHLGGECHYSTFRPKWHVTHWVGGFWAIWNCNCRYTWSLHWLTAPTKTWKRGGIALEKRKAVLNALTGADRMALSVESRLEEFWHTGRSGDWQLSPEDVFLLKEVGSRPSGVDIPESLRQGETNPLTGSSHDSVSSNAEAELPTE